MGDEIRFFPIQKQVKHVMKVAIGSDHRGIEQRKFITDGIVAAGHTPIDRGTCQRESVDYPDIAEDVARAVAAGDVDLGVLLCGTGIGVSIAANKVRGVRAAVCCNLEMARLSRSHNNANILCLSSEAFTEAQFHELMRVWLSTEFESGRHARRVEKIAEIENRQTLTS
jgi:ribose 5-phosphate isomerase B